LSPGRVIFLNAARASRMFGDRPEIPQRRLAFALRAKASNGVDVANRRFI
jgi:hypothetical protein